ncbi:DUF58 domain-containing protein [Microbacterium keratanolyticum]|uniref:DUF58 domain-containing protein n=1 Tax=Microbacterium keratanolyticum TaxID=67574 RepID=UPI00363355F1
MSSLLTPVKSKLFIASSRKSTHALDGAYASLLRGRSLDFEDLRAYEYGDQVRDIDWRATARLGSPMIKRSRATRMHTVLFAVDTGLGMRGLARDERPKKDLAILTIGALGMLSLRHGDDFTLVHGDAARVQRTEIGRSEAALEHTLRRIDGALTNPAPSDRDALLGFIARTISRRMIVVIVTDGTPLTAETERLTRRLRVQHDVLWITLDDADPVLDRTSRHGRLDAQSAWAVPSFLHGDHSVVGELTARDAEVAARRDALLDRLEISHTVLRSQDTAVSDLLHLLNRRRHVGRR